MPESILTVLKLLLLALVYLFFIGVMRAVWASLRPEPAVADVTAGVASDTGTARPAARFRVVEPAEQKGRTFDLGDEVTVGRASGCQVALTDPTVSQLHARVFRRDGKLWVEDLGSRNGTFVNRKQVSSPVAIRRGDRVAVGSTVLEVTR